MRVKDNPERLSAIFKGPLCCRNQSAGSLKMCLMANCFCFWLEQLGVAAHAGSTVDLADLSLGALGQFLCICPEDKVSRYQYCQVMQDFGSLWSSVL